MFNKHMKLGQDRDSWEIHYPEGAIRFIEAFRRQLWDHEGCCKIIDEFFCNHASHVKQVAELGSGTGTNLLQLAKRGYKCIGIERNQESFLLAQSKADELGLDIKFTQQSFSDPLEIPPQDALLSLFVPISSGDMVSLATNVAKHIKPGGYFICMLLCLQDQYRNIDKHSIKNFERVWVDDDVAIRFNFFDKDGPHIDYEGIYLAQQKSGLSMFVDRDIYQLTVPEAHLAVPDELYRHVKRVRVIGKPDQAPPMTYEIVDIYQRVS